MKKLIADLLEELLVDAYGDGEQLGALEIGITDNIEFPFAAAVLGHAVQVEDIEFEGNERRGLIAQTDQGPVSLFDVVPKKPEAIEYLNAYRAWANVELLKATRPRSKATKTSGGTVELVLLRIRESNARCWDLSTGDEVTYKGSGLWRRAPGEIVTIKVRKRWTHGRWPYVSGDIQGHRLDVPALGLDPVPLIERGTSEDGRSIYELERVPIAVKGVADIERELQSLVGLTRQDLLRDFVMEGLLSDLRWMAGHAALAFSSGDPVYGQMLAHLEVGVALGRLSVGDNFEGVLPYSEPENVGFLTCLYGLALEKIRLDEAADGQRLLRWLLELDPEDGVGAGAVLRRSQATV